MYKKIISAAAIVLLLLVAIIAVTQEADELAPSPRPAPAPAVIHPSEYMRDTDEYFYELHDEPERILPEWIRPARWFRSNAGGMALEEIPSRHAALRNNFALVIDFIEPDELPNLLLQHYNPEYFIEKRTLFENGNEKRTQWIFRDENGLTRLIAAFAAISAPVEQTAVAQVVNVQNANVQVAGEEEDTEHDYDETNYNEHYEQEYIAQEQEEQERRVTEPSPRGFIELFNPQGFLITEYRFLDDGSLSKIEYTYRNGFKISAAEYLWEPDDEGGGRFKAVHTDFFFYNRSSFLRSVERVFLSDQEIDARDVIRLTFPGNIFDAARGDFFIHERANPLPEFFGRIIIRENDRMAFTTDERRRVLTQTLYDDQNEVVWLIRNVWRDERIISISKTMGDIELLAEYEYDLNGNRIVERNFRNGVLERIVRTEGNIDTEDLFLHGVVVLRAVWEDGRKISETRVR